LRTEAEQLLYYSIPGFFVFFFAFLFLIAIGNTAILDVRAITFTVAAVMPVGFIVYQAYVLTLYEAIWYGRFFKVQEPCKEIIKSHISEVLQATNPNLVKYMEDKRELSWLHIHTLRLHEQETDNVIDYSWRLINLINARGVGAFTCILAFFMPPFYLTFLCISAVIHKSALPVLPNADTTIMVITYYIAITAFMTVLLHGVPRIKKHLSDFNLGISVSKRKELPEFILAYVSAKVVCSVKGIVSEQKKGDKNFQELIGKAFEHLRNGKWKEALEVAGKAYDESMK
jgi:hypothetical protein